MFSQSAQKKTDVVLQPAPGKPYNVPAVIVNGQKLKVVDKFTYLEGTFSKAVHIDDEVTTRIAKASVVFGRLRANVWERNGIKLDTKLWYCQPSYMHVRHAQYTNVMQRDLTISTYKLFDKAVKIK